MKKVVLLIVAALAVIGAAPAFAADMPVKAAPAAAAPTSPFDVFFGTAFATDYELRGISQTNHKAAVAGYFEGDFKAADWLTLYAGLWGANVSFADAELDISGGGRFSWGNFGLDVGFVYYEYPGPTVPNLNGGSNISYGEFYAKPSYKITDWLSIGGQVYGGDNWANSGQSAWWYNGTVTITLPQFMPLGIGTSISGNVGRQTYDSTLHNEGIVDYTNWDVGVDFNYKAITLDLRYYDTNVNRTSAAQCQGPGTMDLCDGRFVATLKFDTSLSALK